MADVKNLKERIRGEFAASQEKLKQFRTQKVEEHHARQDRLARLQTLFDELAAIWRPRLEALAEEFGDELKVSPSISPGRRHASFRVKSPLASIHLQFSAGSDADVTQLVLAYDLDILPVLMQFERHSEIAFPLDEVEPQALAQWLDDRIVGFVKTYLALGENEYYLKELMVEDPIAKVRFPSFAAGATREKAGRKHYFISEETAREFDQKSS